MGKGKRFEEEQKTGAKKFFAVIVIIALIILFFNLINNMIKKDNTTANSFSELSYFTMRNNGKWGVINSKGEIVISPESKEMIVIPNQKRDVFIYMYDFNEEDGSYKIKAINSNNEQLFSSYNRVEAISNNDENKNIWYNKNALKVEKDGKYGLIDFSGNEILTVNYDEISSLKNIENSLIIKKDDHFGIVNDSGKIIVEPIYKEVKSLTKNYSNGYIVKNDEDNYGVIAINKEQILDCKYSDIKNVYDNGVYVVKSGEEWKFVRSNDDEGIVISNCDIRSMDNENAVVVIDGKYGLMDYEQNVKVPNEYEELKYCFLDCYIAKKDGKFGLINSSSEVKVQFEYDSLVYEKNADCLVGRKNEDSNIYIIDRSFEVKLTCTEYEVLNGYIKAKVEDDYKYYNLKFEEKSNFDAYPNSTLFVVKSNGKYGLVNKENSLVVDYQYDDIRAQNEYGFVAVKKDGKWGVIDQEGKTVVEPSYEIEDESNISVIGKWILTKNQNISCYICK